MRTLRHFLTRPQNGLGLALVLAFFLVALFAPRLAPQPDPEEPSSFRQVRVEDRSQRRIPQPPSASAPFGTTGDQNDIFFTLVWGTRSALRFGLSVTVLTGVLGVLVGAVGGYAGGRVNTLLLRVTDAFLAIPLLAGVWMLAQMLLPLNFTVNGSPHPLILLLDRLRLTPLMLGFILFSWMPYARLTNAAMLHLRTETFVEAARALGAGPLRLIVRHMLPHAIAPALVLAARDVGAMVVLDATFQVIGIGSLEWGNLLVYSRDWILGVGGNPLLYWWVFIPSTLTLILFGIGWNLLGDGVNSALNPQSRE